MIIRIAINGYGRIGRCILKALYEQKSIYPNLQIVAINDMGQDLAIHAHLTKHDSVHGLFNENVEHDDKHLIINNHKIQFFANRNPELLPWKDLNIDVVFECTGFFTSKNKAQAHLTAGAKKVLISAPGGNDVDATIVYGVNHQVLTKQMTIISNASCTTNCLAPIAQIINEKFTIISGLMTTIHAFTNDQVLNDTYHEDIRRGRSASLSMIPTKTGAAKAVGLVLPELNGKLDGLAIRIPTPNVSLIDLSVIIEKSTTIEAVNEIMRNYANTKLKNILRVNDQEYVSIDFNHNTASSIFDATQTKIMGNLLKVFSWYDNEWGFSNRMLDVTNYWFSLV